MAVRPSTNAFCVICSIILFSAAAPAYAQGYASLFNDTTTSRWTPAGRLPDWSWAGAYAGDVRPSARSNTVFNVRDFGARGNGATDDTPAIRAAINAAGAAGGGIVFLPAGRYRIQNRIRITKSNVVMRGSGIGKTIIYIPNSLTHYTGYRAPSTGETWFSWNDAFIGIKGPVARSSQSSTFLATVTADSKRGARTLRVSSTSGFQKGQWVRLFVSDRASDRVGESLVSELYGGMIEKSTCRTKCIAGLRGSKDQVRWMSRIESVSSFSGTIVLERPLPINLKAAWRPTLHSISPSTPQNCGIESLSVQFKYFLKSAHGREAGFNAIVVDDAVNAWVRDIEIVNADNGIVTHRSQFVTIEGVKIRVARNRVRSGKKPWNGHLGIALSESTDVQVTKFDIQTRHWHDISVRGTMLCAFHNGQGYDLNIDSHRSAPYATLYSNLYMGLGRRPFITGGSTARGFPAAQFTTYYNLRRRGFGPITLPRDTVQGRCSWGTNLNFRGRFQGQECLSYFVDYRVPISPPDLLVTQRADRRRRTQGK